VNAQQKVLDTRRDPMLHVATPQPMKMPMPKKEFPQARRSCITVPPAEATAPPSTTHLHVRIPLGLMRTLELVAAADDRTVSYVVRRALEEQFTDPA